MWEARPGAGRSEELPGFAEVAGIDLASVAGLGRQRGTHRVREAAEKRPVEAPGRWSVGPYLADSAGPVAAGTEQVSGGGGLAQALAAGAAGAAVCPTGR